MEFKFTYPNKYRISNEDGLANYESFASFEDACNFVGWFNECIKSYGSILFADICTELGYDLTKETTDIYLNYGYTDPIDLIENQIRTITDSELGTRYVVCFPMDIKNFSEEHK